MRPSYLADAPAISRHALAARRANLTGEYDKRLDAAAKDQAKREDDAWKATEELASHELASIILDQATGRLDLPTAQRQADELRPYLPKSDFDALAKVLTSPTPLRETALKEVYAIRAQFGGRVIVNGEDRTDDWRLQKLAAEDDENKRATMAAQFRAQDAIFAEAVRYTADQADALTAKGVDPAVAMQQIRAGLATMRTQAAARRIDSQAFTSLSDAMKEDVPDKYLEIPEPPATAPRQPADGETLLTPPPPPNRRRRPAFLDAVFRLLATPSVVP
jgi:hypothetical protein